jgi:anti-sigma regulatory factor (Ser/Thr protein kinase)
MALATSISYAVAVLVSCLHFRRPHNTLRLVNIRDLTSELARITKTGLPEALSRLVGLLRALILNNLLIVIGGVGAVTVFSVRSNANYIVGAITLGVGHSIIPLVGVFFGEEDRRVLKDVLVTTLKTGFVINAAAALLLALLAGEFSALFGVSDHATVAASSEAVRLFALSMPLMMLNLTMMNFYQSTKNLLLANVICLGEGFLLVIGLTFLLQGFMGVSSVWLAFFLAEFFMILVILLLIRRKSGRWPKSMDDCLLLPTDFGGKPEDILDLSIGNSLADVVTIARQVGPFCTAHGIEDRRSYLLSLGIEEMAGNVVRHSFKPGVRQFLDIRILIKGERLILRVRDNGSRFDPFAYLAKQDPADICSNIGIRLIQRLAVKVDYRYTVGLNNLIITI